MACTDSVEMRRPSIPARLAAWIRPLRLVPAGLVCNAEDLPETVRRDIGLADGRLTGSAMRRFDQRSLAATFEDARRTL